MAVKKNTLLIVAGSLLILLLIGVTILLISEKQTNKELVMEFNLDKEDLENQYTDFARQYDELKLTVSNDSLSVLLEQEQLKTQRLLEELRTVKSSNATEIRRLKKELASLRKVMIGYINHQVTIVAELHGTVKKREGALLCLCLVTFADACAHFKQRQCRRVFADKQVAQVG